MKNEGTGFRSFPTAREALAVFEKEKFDLIFMDVQMPDMDGFEATARPFEIAKKAAQSGNP